MKDLTVFNPEFGSIRTAIIDDKPYFCASDVAKALGYSNANDAVMRHCRAIVKHDTPISGKMQEINFISEGDVYRLIVKSKLPSAEKFESWVFDEVLPSIRKHGAYMTEQTIEKALESPDFLIKLATKLKEEKAARKLAEETLEQQQPLVDFANKVSESSNLINMGKMAKLLSDENIKIGRNTLFSWLRKEKILMKDNIPYQKYIDNGYFEVKESTYETPYGVKSQQVTLVTGKGQIYITEKLRTAVKNGTVKEDRGKYQWKVKC